jgi:hypothetical protein
LANLGHSISDTTVGSILKAHGMEPAPQRKHQTTWKTFIKAHWEVLAAIHFTTVEVWTPRGLVTDYLLFVMEVGSRRVHLAGCTTNPTADWMKQIARNLTDPLEGFLRHKRYLLMDRDTKYSEAFRHLLEQAGVDCVRLPARSPNLTPHIERFMVCVRPSTPERRYAAATALPTGSFRSDVGWSNQVSQGQTWADAEARAVFQFCGSNSSRRLIGVAAMRPSTSRR